MRALVLGGGGVTGIAWETGMLHGLEQHGVRLRDADRVIGTSAGSAVAARIAGPTPLADLYRAQLDGDVTELAAHLGASGLLRIVVAGLDPDRRRGLRRLGRQALAAKTVSAEARRAVIAARLSGEEWPGRDLQITAVDSAAGELHVFDRTSGVSLVDAVAASCAVPLVWPSVRIAGRDYYDGGLASAANAHLASGASRVVVLAPVAAGIRPGTSVASQLRALGDGVGSIVITPDRAARSLMGSNSLDPAKRPAAAAAGLRQAESVAADVAAVWG
jgi:NTE family protein